VLADPGSPGQNLKGS